MIAAIVEETLIPEDAAAAVSHSGAGAVVMFAGTVRDHSQGRAVTHLEYQTYMPMAQSEMERIVKEAEQKWDVKCAAWHRIGKLAIGEISVVIAVASAHRGQAFEACRFAIDTIKKEVPIWKKEWASDGSWWVEDPFANLTEPPTLSQTT